MGRLEESRLALGLELGLGDLDLVSRYLSRKCCSQAIPKMCLYSLLVYVDPVSIEMIGAVVLRIEHIVASRP